MERIRAEAAWPQEYTVLDGKCLLCWARRLGAEVVRTVVCRYTRAQAAATSLLVLPLCCRLAFLFSSW